MLKDY
ncbi:uncharacterized protein FFB14_07451 [Fusarium fujikuroi]